MDFCKQTEELWRIYFSAAQEETQQALELLDENVVIIGTGAHEFYNNRRAFSGALDEEVREREDIAFHFKNFWCEQKEIGPDACLVYGGVYIWWESDDKRVSIDMDSRFSVLYQRVAGVWKVVHIHQSMPNREQLAGEYYPKTLTEQVRKAQAIADELAQLAQRDALTGLVNYRTLQELWESWNRPNSWLFILDLDDFKEINDTFGHMTGNRVLQRIASLLSDIVRAQDVVCRMGGDEFILLCGDLKEPRDADALARRILQSAKEEGWGQSDWPGVSIGATKIGKGETLEGVVARADRALYAIKKTTKNGYRIE